MILTVQPGETSMLPGSLTTIPPSLSRSPSRSLAGGTHQHLIPTIPYHLDLAAGTARCRSIVVTWRKIDGKKKPHFEPRSNKLKTPYKNSFFRHSQPAGEIVIEWWSGVIYLGWACWPIIEWDVRCWPTIEAIQLIDRPLLLSLQHDRVRKTSQNLFTRRSKIPFDYGSKFHLQQGAPIARSRGEWGWPAK